MNITVVEIVLLILVILKFFDGYRKGMVREIISFISVIVLCMIAALAANGIKSYLKGEFLAVAVMVFLFALLGIAHKFLGLLVLPAKLISDLPVIRFVDKLLGAAVGVLEVVLFLWTVYTLVMMADLGMAGQMVLQYTSENWVLTWLYEHNYLAYAIQVFGVQFLEKMQIMQ